MEQKEVFIVGVGSSAGGLEALREMLKKLPNNEVNFAIVVLQHLSPTYKSMLSEILSKSVPPAWRVMSIKDEVNVEPNTVYVTPPDRNLYLEKNTIKLEHPPIHIIAAKPSIDRFFSSLAQEKKDKAIGVILSGTGSDGTLGAKAIRTQNGVIIVQDPEEAKYEGMPMSVIQAECADYVAKVEEIPELLIDIISSYPPVKVEPILKNNLLEILGLLENAFKVDFKKYKRTTILRRVKRRMDAVGAATYQDYIEYIKKYNNELHNLYKDMLIGVTSFFRDPESFNNLKKELQDYYINHFDSDVFRVWVVGCSTGEEPYSVAMILDSILGKGVATKIFATDIDLNALAVARRGIYSPMALKNLPLEMINQYFIKKGEFFEIKSYLKEKIVFSRHDIISDPPFINMDLITCRNLLIYFNPETQKKVLGTFAFSLKTNGILFLGKSETIGHLSKLFEVKNVKNKIYASKVTSNTKKSIYTEVVNKIWFGKMEKKEEQENKLSRAWSIEDSIKDTLFRYYEDKCLVIDKDFNIMFIKGDLNNILKIPEGNVATMNFLKMAPSELSIDIRAYLYKAFKNEITLPALVITKLPNKIIRTKIAPIENNYKDVSYFLLTFEVSDRIMDKGHGTSDKRCEERIKELQKELILTKEHLQTVIEELEASNEELQASSEELQATNEELQASNEELETTNEELQATNEELKTAYTEIKALYDKQQRQKEELEAKTKELKMLKETYRVQYEFLNRVLDAEKHLVLVTDGIEIKSVNKQFLDFFDFKDLNEVKAKINNIGELFLATQDDGYVYEGKNGKTWIQQLEQEQFPKVLMKKDGKTFTFHIGANRVDLDNFYVITLTDISNLENKTEPFGSLETENILNRVIDFRIFSIYGIKNYIVNFTEKVYKIFSKLYQLIKKITEDTTENNTLLDEFIKIKNNLINEIEFLRLVFTQQIKFNYNLQDLFEKIIEYINCENCKINVIVQHHKKIEKIDPNIVIVLNLTLLLLDMLCSNIAEIKHLTFDIMFFLDKKGSNKMEISCSQKNNLGEIIDIYLNSIKDKENTILITWNLINFLLKNLNGELKLQKNKVSLTWI